MENKHKHINDAVNDEIQKRKKLRRLKDEHEGERRKGISY